ncbi:DUF1080 domain-containing protein [Actinoalloteichus sp. AHMU CJ021]|uniref:3-keto-alpha-glucoside-1,2-lyase/3-keto-2-hydroxy-glucal hydratase domain-containing protein n=1 Tax=Actinoalloteichus caeruleus DSM 43889 TaxID=1120930 RepID=A0ABT1JCW9_ACTCY|nr:DUF1080 domain-containing protein [Actinoalloteichus caeruleus]AUS80630.1 DUF1080 domain-containing protein [Actinoalloteichus sp. AHMU CJ021]MCP2330013.1 protein of unknown function (DUF1080) [Actinoalloteichus caeruleus DSM 43889]
MRALISAVVAGLALVTPGVLAGPTPTSSDPSTQDTPVPEAAEASARDVPRALRCAGLPGGLPGHGITRLWDGETLEGWSQAGPGGFDVVDGTLQTRDGMGLLWYDRAPFGDYTLFLDWRVTAETDNSGVFLRFPDPGDDPWVAVDHGYEVQINDNPGGDPQKTGAIYNQQDATSHPSRPVGEWNRYALRVEGERYRVYLNGELVNDFTSDDPDRGTVGHIGLQNHDPDTRTQFRDIWLVESCR